MDDDAPRLLVVLLEQRRQVRVHPGQLLLVDAGAEGWAGERHQPEGKFTLTPLDADQSLAGHPLERAVSRVGVHACAGGDVGRRLGGQAHHGGQYCLLQGEYRGQHPQFHAAPGGGEAIGDGIQPSGQLAIDVLRHWSSSWKRLDSKRLHCTPKVGQRQARG